MGKVVSHMTMSLDGFIADPQDGVDELFGWYEAGTVTVPTAAERWSFKVDERSAQMLREALATTGALVCGRRLFDHTSGWDDRHPVGAPVVVVTHHPPQDAAKWTTITFAGSVESGIAAARQIAGDKDVTIASANIAAQALDLGLVDEVTISLVPVLMGTGVNVTGKSGDGGIDGLGVYRLGLTCGYVMDVATGGGCPSGGHQ